MASLINIGMSGLGAAQSGMYTLGNNIANADVESYSRQQNVQKTKGGQQVGQVFIGSEHSGGLTMTGIQRLQEGEDGVPIGRVMRLAGPEAGRLEAHGHIDAMRGAELVVDPLAVRLLLELDQLLAA